MTTETENKALDLEAVTRHVQKKFDLVRREIYDGNCYVGTIGFDNVCVYYRNGSKSIIAANGLRELIGDKFPVKEIIFFDAVSDLRKYTSQLTQIADRLEAQQQR